MKNQKNKSPHSNKKPFIPFMTRPNPPAAPVVVPQVPQRVEPEKFKPVLQVERPAAPSLGEIRSEVNQLGSV